MDMTLAEAITQINYHIIKLKNKEDGRTRALAIAITNLETGVMWLQQANSEQK